MRRLPIRTVLLALAAGLSLSTLSSADARQPRGLAKFTTLTSACLPSDPPVSPCPVSVDVLADAKGTPAFLLSSLRQPPLGDLVYKFKPINVLSYPKAPSDHDLATSCELDGQYDAYTIGLARESGTPEASVPVSHAWRVGLDGKIETLDAKRVICANESIRNDVD